MTDLDALSALAKAATPGPWQLSLNEDYIKIGAYGPWSEPLPEWAGTVASAIRLSRNADANSWFIAAFSPDVALALLARVQKAEAALSVERIAEAICDLMDGSRPYGDYPLPLPQYVFGEYRRKLSTQLAAALLTALTREAPKAPEETPRELEWQPGMNYRLDGGPLMSPETPPETNP